MALARLLSRGQRGMEAYEVTVEVHLGSGLPGFTVTGLPAAAVRESRDRVRAALQNIGMPIPPSRVTAHLGPADIPKQGGRFDLAIALGIVKADTGKPWKLDAMEFLGELSLSGDLRSVQGALPAVLAARDAQHTVVLPAVNASEAALVEGAHILVANRLTEVIEHLEGIAPLERIATAAPAPAVGEAPDLADVRGQLGAKRALTIAAAGGHNMLMIGPPGAGKSMLAQRLPGLLPPLGVEEILEVACIASVAGRPSAEITSMQRPFRAPHHSASSIALVGGGGKPRPGEISLAHRGVLFLDEFPEFQRGALEALREPLESGTVTIARAAECATYPASFQLVAAMNPCPCGYLGDGSDRCTCSEIRVQCYRSRLSGPLLDRFDIHVALERVSIAGIADAEPDSTSAQVAAHVDAARKRQLGLHGCLNARLDDRRIWRDVRLGREQRRLLVKASDRWRLSARSCTRIVKVARTIADLDAAADVAVEHVAEAIQLRCLDR
ncbi:MAG TPA: YifB family Mg chelatase-like AAA ATPase [Gammaproteobacteria bacterium]